MKMMVMLAAVATLGLPPAHAGEAKPLTVEEVVNIGAALRSLSVQPDARGNLVPVPAGTYRFMGRALVQLAIVQQQADVVKRAYEDAIQSAIKDAFGEESPLTVQADPKRKDEYEDKNNRFKESAKKALAAPAGVTLGRLREIDLCLDAKPPACPIANPISIDTVTLLLPVLDRDGQ